MKTERRHELRTNELGAFLLDANDWARKNATPLGGGVLIVVLALLAIRFVQSSRSRSMNDALVSIAGLSFTNPDETASAFDTLEEIIHDARSEHVRMTALLRKGQAALSLSMRDGFHPEHLDRAAAAFEALKTEFPESVPVVAVALSALATIEENRFVVDHDPAHRQVAERYLTRVRDEPQFKGTPYQTDAAQRLQHLDEVFQVITLAEPLPEPVGPSAPAESTATMNVPKPQIEVKQINVTPSADTPQESPAAPATMPPPSNEPRPQDEQTPRDEPPPQEDEPGA